jgi:hypothetical protein
MIAGEGVADIQSFPASSPENSEGSLTPPLVPIKSPPVASSSSTPTPGLVKPPLGAAAVHSQTIAFDGSGRFRLPPTVVAAPDMAAGVMRFTDEYPMTGEMPIKKHNAADMGVVMPPHSRPYHWAAS